MSRPTWAEVSLSALRHNFRVIQDHVGAGVTVCAVIKADAYGHGLVDCARALEAESARWFGVTSTEEGVRLREGGIRERILLMTGFWHGEEDDVIRYNLTPAIWESWHIEGLQFSAQKLRSKEQPVAVHLKIDTGMSRLGAPLADLAQLAAVLRRSPQLSVEGIFTHLASAELLDAGSAGDQLSAFEKATAKLRELGIHPQYQHIANSAALAARPESWKNFVRPGISLYGYFLRFVPGRTAGLPVKPVLSWKTRIISLRDVGAAQPIGYGGAYITQAPARIAALPVGYGDGLSRQLSSRGRVIVHERCAPMVGNVSMDITLIDVTKVSVAVGDEVTIIGGSREHCITASEHASLARTIPYEVLCNISKRVPRMYVE